MSVVTVDLGDDSYPIYINRGTLQELADLVEKHKLTEDIFIITDENVKPLYADHAVERLQEKGYSANLLSVPAGEQSKSIQQANQLYTSLLENGATRNSSIVAIGGGVVGDLAGFVAATFMRGVPYVQVPTTILAQVDSSVGGKVGINHPLGKNLIGAFYQPKFVLIDADVLHTLPEREIRAGLAEVLKYGFIKNENLYQLMFKHHKTLFSLENLSLLQGILSASCMIKAEVVQRDEKEMGLRAILNFGHTVGHALEACTHYQTFLHGEAVLHGMKAALMLSVQAGQFEETKAREAIELIHAFQVPGIPDSVDVESIMNAMKKDKKRSKAGQLWILLRNIGAAYMSRSVNDQDVRSAVQFMLEDGR